ncbi:MAG: prepilin-type N-terminal cleavage/methylation domain-containing protein [Planctomycetes bacterium]|nr:prepilin-type N-terminal cleavage/methylation domain-containing protein [Planctomycetota bacterium]
MKHMMQHREAHCTANRRELGAFTLIELLVVVAIIGLLVSILLPSLAAAREQAKILVCATNLRTMLQATALYAQDNKDHAPLHGSDPYIMISGNGPYPSPPYWDARLVQYTGTKTYNPKLFSCPTVRAYWQKNDSATVRTYRMNLTVGGWDKATNTNKDEPTLSSFKFPGRTLVYTEDWSAWTYNTIWAWNLRDWFDLPVAHLWTDFTATAWGPRPASGGSNFSFIDGHVAFTRHIDGYPDNRVENYIINPNKDF